VTGDKQHFGQLYKKTLRNVKVISVAEALSTANLKSSGNG
jgi:hypothetical protein